MGREDKLIKLIKSLTGEELIGDDCAVLPSGMLVSSDMLVQGKHFLLPQMNLNDLGWKALAVNLSDIAAMGAQSEFAVVNIAFPTSMSDNEFEHLYKGIIDCAKTYNCR
ncbi:MAG TPA: AIR synthase related protein, partial [Candidatus Melainabacteria bacterium]|nr:AIR synthase related protein [Candidatus Melainabacteria bacterium]